MSVDVLAEAGGGAGDVALVSASRVWTYGALSEEIGRRSEALHAEGARPNDLVPIVAEADADFIVSLLALWRIGAVPLPLHPRSTQAERAAAEAVVAATRRVPDGTQAVVWTSGTAGRPRGVVLTFDAFAASAVGAAERLDLGRDDVWLASLSPAHVGGLALIIRSLLLGGAMVAAGAFAAATADDAIEGRGLPPGAPGPVTHASFVPTQLLRLLDHRAGGRATRVAKDDAAADGAGHRDAPAPSTFRCALVGGAHAPAALVERARRAGWPLALTYGCTEMCSQVATAAPDLVRRKPGTVGTPLPGTRVRIGDGQEILVRGATCAAGYLSGGSDSGLPDGRPAPPRADRASVHALQPVVAGDGWYRTGDLGRIDEEGHLWVTGRRIDRIVSGGVSVDAVEVEEALRSHPAVADACVVGVPDEEWGERVAAWIEPAASEASAFAAAAVDLDDVGTHVRERLSAAKVPRRWYVEGPLPRNANGKIDRAVVRARLAAG